MQRQKGKLLIRLRSIGGNLDSSQLREMAELAEKYGKGYVHITTRQGVEIPWIKQGDCEAVLDELNKHGLKIGASGPRIRTVMACPGREVCRFGLMNSRRTGIKLDQVFFGREVPMKTKIGVSGCPNSCAKPQVNDIGLVGAVEPKLDEEKCVGCGICEDTCPNRAISMIDDKPVIDRARCLMDGKCIASCPVGAWREKRRGFLLYVGGKIGRNPRLGQVIDGLIPESQVIKAVEKVLKAFEDLGKKGERIADTIDRVGLDEFRAKYRSL
ncbi:MAG: 4Fe-4S binding protein [Firmicutes bacterium]|nr:4Fe-4S binding protein [Bacillota bacterium]